MFCFIHNVYFDNSYNLFVNKASINASNFALMNINTLYEGLKNIIYFNFNDQSVKTILFQILKWNPYYNIHRLIILFLIIYYIFKYKQTLFTYSLVLCMFSQHGVLILTRPDSRYAYLAWLLTILIFFKIDSENKIFIKSKNCITSLIKKN